MHQSIVVPPLKKGHYQKNRSEEVSQKKKRQPRFQGQPIKKWLNRIKIRSTSTLSPIMLRWQWLYLLIYTFPCLIPASILRRKWRKMFPLSFPKITLFQLKKKKKQVVTVARRVSWEFRNINLLTKNRTLAFPAMFSCCSFLFFLTYFLPSKADKRLNWSSEWNCNDHW